MVSTCPADGLAVWANLALYLVAWQVHIAAMMLPLMSLFNQASTGQRHPGLARIGFLGGYLVVWIEFGIVALVGDALLGWVAVHGGMLRPEWMAGAVLLLAGAFQFSTLKERCLGKCRQPRVFLLNHYRRGMLGGLALGARHGAFCVGCCWALMLVMFLVGGVVMVGPAWLPSLVAMH